MDKYIGKKLEGRYEITELIGVGGMADVYKATDIIDNKEVAVKILKKEFAENEEFLRRFRNESKAIALLSHPNIVKVYDVNFTDRLQYIVMEYIDGITLKEYIDNERVLTWKDSVHFIIQVLRALQHAHDRGIVHRDIKPQNIMLFTDGTIKVMDFGIAKFARDDGGTATNQAIGTVHYISPEQARGDETDEKSDIYSVGVMLYEMLTGQKPFDTDNPISIAVMHMQNTPERPRAINPNIPAGLEEIILRAMEKDPEDRYQTAADMICDIEAFKANNAITFGYYAEERESAPEEKVTADSPTQYFSSARAQQEVRRTSTPTRYQDNDADYDDDYDDDYYDDEDDEEEEEERHSLFIPVMTAITIAFIVVAVLFVLWLIKGVIKGTGSSNKYEMPNLVGMDYYEAKDKYTFLDLQIDKTDYTSDEKDVIYFQDIQVGEAVSNGQEVKVYVSLGFSMAVVPDVKDYPYEYACKILDQMGFIPQVLYEMSSDGTEKSNVIRTEPSDGQEAEVGSTIIVYVSKGYNNDAIEVDNVVGLALEAATRNFEYFGLVVEAVGAPSLEEEGTVIEQSIAPGELVEAGTTIILTYSNGEDPSGVITYTLPIPGGVSGAFTIDVIDESGTSRSSKRIVAGVTNSASIDIQGTGTETLTVVLTSNDGKTATIGVYKFDFANATFTTVREDINAAFTAVGATEPTTEPPTEPPTDAPTDPPAEPVTDPQPPQTETPAATEPMTNPELPPADAGNEG